MERRLRRERFVIERPCFSVYAGTTAEWLTSHLDQATATGGFLARFCFFAGGHKGQLLVIPPGLDCDQEDHLATAQSWPITWVLSSRHGRVPL
jgi:hypothetical protein